jgi:hypothetical protein
MDGSTVDDNAVIREETVKSQKPQFFVLPA